MFQNAFLKLGLLLVVLIATGCKNVTVIVDSPDAETVYTDVPTFSVRWEGGGSAEEFNASLNGVDITERFAVTDTTATLTDPSLISELRHNKNLFIASQGAPALGGLVPSSSTVKRTFIADLKGPHVQVLSTTENVGVNTLVEGKVSDPSGVASLSYSTSSGQSGGVVLNEDNTFTLDLAYSDPNEVVFTATDTLGQVSSTTFYRTADGVLEETLNFRANVEALTVISEIAPDLIAALDLPALISNTQDPLVEINLLLLGSLEAFVDSAAMSVPVVDIGVPEDASMDLDLDVQVQDLDLQMRLCWNPLLLPRVCQEAFVDSTALFADVLVDLGADNEGVLTIEDLVMGFNVTGLDVGLNLFNIDSWGISLPDILLPITDALINAFGNLFVDLFRPLLDDILTAVLGEVPMAVTMNVQYPGEEEPRSIDIGTFFNDISRDGDNLVMTMGLNNNITPHSVVDPLGIRTFGFSPATEMTTPSGADADFVFSLSASFMNHLLHDIYMSGIINADVPIGAVGGKPAFARVIPTEPPYMSIEDFGLGMAELHINNFSVAVEVQVDAEDPAAGYETYFNVTLDMVVPVSLTAPGEGTLGVEVSNQLSLTTSNLVVSGGGLNDATINSLISTLSGPIVNGLSNALQQIQLPTILGMNIVPVEIWADKSNGTFIIAGDLELAEELPEVITE